MVKSKKFTPKELQEIYDPLEVDGPFNEESSDQSWYLASGNLIAIENGDFP